MTADELRLRVKAAATKLKGTVSFCLTEVGSVVVVHSFMPPWAALPQSENRTFADADAALRWLEDRAQTFVYPPQPYTLPTHAIAAE